MGLSAATEEKTTDEEKTPSVSWDMLPFKSRKICNQKRSCRRRPRGKIKTQEGRCLQEKPREETISVKECKLSYEPPKHCKDKDKEATRDQGTWPQDMMAELDKSSPKWSGGVAVRMVMGDGGSDADNPLDSSYEKEQRWSVTARGDCGVKIEMG